MTSRSNTGQKRHDQHVSEKGRYYIVNILVEQIRKEKQKEIIGRSDDHKIESCNYE